MDVGRAVSGGEVSTIGGDVARASVCMCATCCWGGLDASASVEVLEAALCDADVAPHMHAMHPCNGCIPLNTCITPPQNNKYPPPWRRLANTTQTKHPIATICIPFAAGGV